MSGAAQQGPPNAAGQPGSDPDRDRVEEPVAGARMRQRVNASFVIALLLMAFLGVLSWRVVQQAASDADWVAHTHEVMTSLEATLRQLLDVETGGRGFALTGDSRFLEPYESGKRATALNLQALHALVADPDQAQRLKTLEVQAQRAVGDVDVLVTTRENTGKPPTLALLARGKTTMDATRATVASMEDGEKLLLEQRTRHARTAQGSAVSMIALGSFLGMAFLSAAGIFVGREIDISTRAQTQVRALNSSLEVRVAERTKELGESETRLAGVIQSAMDAILTVDEQQCIVLFNATAEKMFLCTAAEALGQPVSRFIPQRFHAAHREHIRRFGANGSTSRSMGAANALWAVRADGSEFQIEASISRVVAGGKKLFTVILRDVTERKQAEEVREHLAAVVDSSDDAIISKDLDGTINGWNRGAEKIFGYTALEAVGKPMLMLFPPDRVHEEADILARIPRGESVEHFETVRVRKDGETIDVSVTISPIKNASGKVVGASKIARDITERRLADEALREKEQMLSESQRIAHVGSWSFDPNDPGGRIVWSDELYRIYGVSPQTFTPTVESLLRLVVPEDRTTMQNWIAACAAGEQPGEFEFRVGLADGSIRSVSGRGELQVDANHRPVRMMGSAQDITERKRVEERLAAQAEELARSREALQSQAVMLKLVLDNMGEGLVAADREGHFLIWNNAAQTLMGRGASDVPQEQWTPHYKVFLPDGVTPYPTDQLPLVRALRGESVSVELIVQPPEASTGRFMEVVARPLKDAQGNHCGGVAVLRDITQKKADEREIRELNDVLELRVLERTAQLQEANEELESFTYSVAHDLRAPLRHIAGFSGILVEEFAASLEPQAQGYLGRIHEGTRKMGQLVDELLNLARVGRQEATLQPVGLNSLVKEVIGILQPEIEGRQVQWKIADLPIVECDSTLIKQVFQNLISNAIKYSRPRAQAVIEIGPTTVDGRSAIYVRDNGVGFSMKYADKLFGVFQRLHRSEDFEGTGVGLATVQRIIKKHQGRVWAEAELDRGATFYFTLGGMANAESEKELVLTGAQS